MKKIIALLFVSAFGFGLTAHAADVDAKGTAKQEKVKTLRVQADKAHKKGDALTAQADKLESEAGAKSGEKMRGCNSTATTGMSDCQIRAGGQQPSPNIVHNPTATVYQPHAISNGSAIVHDSGRGTKNISK